MTTCRDLDRLFTPYLDGEVGPADRLPMDEHLNTCMDCRHRIGAEAAARTVLKARAASLAVQAPPGLRTRCAALAAQPRSRGLWALPRWVSVPAMAALVLVLGVAGFRAVAGRSATVLASELALDHLKCFGVFEGTSGPPDARRLETKLHDQYGWTMAVPDEDVAGELKIVGARRCLYHDGGIAHVMYRYRGQPVSLFMLPDTAEGAHNLSVLGHETRIWSVGQTTYAVVMRGDRRLVDDVTLRLRRLVH